MAYTEVKERNGRKYYYRVLSVRKGKAVSKKRKYLGVNLSKNELLEMQAKADKELYLKNKRGQERIVERIKPKIIEVLKKHGIKKAGIFGSYAFGKQKKDSDIDVLIKPAKNMSLFGFVKVQLELEGKLGKKVDLVSYNGINPLLKKSILQEEVRIL